MDGYYRSLDNNSEKLDYLYYAIPKRWFNRGLEEFGFENKYSNLSSEQKNDLLTNFSEFESCLFNVIEKILVTTRLNRTTKFFEHLAEYKNKSENLLREEMDLNDLFFFEKHYFNNRSSSIITPIKKYEQLKKDFNNINENEKESFFHKIITQNEEFNKAISVIGNNFWSYLDNRPKPQFGYIKGSYLFFNFVSKGSVYSKYDQRKGEYIDIQRINNLVIRLDFERGICELQPQTFKNENIERVKEKIEMLFNGNIELEDNIEITDEFIRYMANEMSQEIECYVESTLGKHEGPVKKKATGEEVYEDDIYEEYIKDDPHIEKNIRYDLSSDVSFDNPVNIGFSKKENKFMVHKSILHVNDRRKIVGFLRDHYENFNSRINE